MCASRLQYPQACKWDASEWEAPWLSGASSCDDCAEQSVAEKRAIPSRLAASVWDTVGANVAIRIASNPRRLPIFRWKRASMGRAGRGDAVVMVRDYGTQRIRRVWGTSHLLMGRFREINILATCRRDVRQRCHAMLTDIACRLPRLIFSHLGKQSAAPIEVRPGHWPFDIDRTDQ